ncbi:MAG: S8 family peptidase [Terriglobales bacterium]
MEMTRKFRFQAFRSWLTLSFIFAFVTAAAWASGFGVLVQLNPSDVASFDARHTVQSLRLNPNRDLYLISTSDSRTDQQLLTEIETDPAAGNPELNQPVGLYSALDQSTASVLNGSATPSGTSSSGGGLNLTLGGPLGALLNPITHLLTGILNPLLGSVLNLNISLGGTGTSVSAGSSNVLNSAPKWFYGAVVPSSYVTQPMLRQISAGARAYALSTGDGAVVALIGNGVDPFNPVLSPVLLYNQGYNFYDNSPDWSAYADLGDGNNPTAALQGYQSAQSTASVLNGQTTPSTLDQSTASVLNGTPCATQFGGSGLDQSTASVLNQSTASVLNGADTESAALTAITQILTCDPDFGHGTAVAGLIHLIAPKAKILPIKAFGPGGTADAASIYASITYAIDHGVNVMNLSFSATAATGYVQQAIEEAVQDGIVVVAAGGNSSTSAAVFPASDAGVIGTGAVDGTQAGYPLAAYSNFDSGPGQYVDVDVAAPGSQLFTTFPGGGQIWATVVGTSFSTPLVAGEAALLVQLHTTGTAAKTVIDETANPSVTANSQGQIGHGLIDVLGALRSASPSLLSLLGW